MSARRHPDPHNPLALHLSSYQSLTDADLQDLESCIGSSRQLPAGCELGGEAPHKNVLWVIQAGWVGEGTVLNDGRRQLYSLRLPGDVSDPYAGTGRRLMALTSVVFAEIHDIERLIAGPALRAAWRAMRAAERDRLYDQMLRLGRLSAMERVAHLLLDLQARLQRVGLASASDFTLPLSQDILADVLGLSLVHMNRTWGQLRREGIIAGRQREVTILDRDRLARLAGYGTTNAA